MWPLSELEREISSAGDRPFMLVSIYSCVALRHKVHGKASSWLLGHKLNPAISRQLGTTLGLLLWKQFSDDMTIVNHVLNPLCLTLLCHRCKFGILQLM